MHVYYSPHLTQIIFAESRDLRYLETRGPWAVASRAQRGRY